MKKLLAIALVLSVVAVFANSAEATVVINDQSFAANTMTGTWYDQTETYATEIWYYDNCKWAYGDGSVFTWNFSGLANDTYYAYASWKNSGDGSTAAVYSGLDSGSVTINQGAPPNDTIYNDESENVPFGYLGTVTVTDGTAAISLTSSVSYPYADAIALDSENPPPTPKTYIVNDEDDPGNTETGTWYDQPQNNPTENWYNQNSDWAYADGSVFTWNFSELDNGVYEVYASWQNSGDGSSNAVYSGMDGGSVTIDQKMAPGDVGIEGVAFGYLGLVTVTDGTAAISLEGLSNYPYADAIALTLIPEPATVTLLVCGLIAAMSMLVRCRLR